MKLLSKLHPGNEKMILFLLQTAVVTLFLGRAWQHLVWDAPFRTLLWDEGLMKGIIEALLSLSWQEYITSPIIDSRIQLLIQAAGGFYLICALMAIFIKKWKKLASVFMILGSTSLLILALFYCKERFFSLGQFFEYTLQFSAPLFLLYFVKNKSKMPKYILFLKIAIALTFACHGLYAIGYYPRPGYFTEMTMLILHIEEETAVTFLKIAGILDFIIAVMIFFSFRFAKWLILYAAVWGLLTSIARVWAYVEMDYLIETLKQYAHETLYRFPHFLLPIVLFSLLNDD